MVMKKKQYDEKAIQTLDALAHIRLRSGMYVGRLGDGSHEYDGIYIMLKEVIDNSIDEFIMGFGKKISVLCQKDKAVQIRDFGRGIPFGKLIDCASIINTGAKYNNDVFQFSVGLNGVGLKAVNALSSVFTITSYRTGKYATAVFKKGKLQHQKQGTASKEKDGTYVSFLPDDEIFKDFSFQDEFIISRLQDYAYLNTGVRIYYANRIFYSENGLQDFLEGKLGGELCYPILHHHEKQMEFSVTHTEVYGENIFSFVNGQYTSDGGTHQSAFREGLVRAVNDYFQKNYITSDIREGIAAAFSIRIKDPLFESQTKNKLGNTDIRPWIVQKVHNVILHLLLKNPQSAQRMGDKIARNEQLRKELSVVRKQARDAAKKVALNIRNLKDSKYHRGDSKENGQSMIFITEGQSAAGSMISARNVYTQAIYALRGKPKNMYDKKKADIYRTEELHRLIIALGIEQDIDTLRYEKIVLATDADHDGYHIRNLLITFFLTYYEGLIMSQHLFILETPLFRVRNKEKNIYCYSEREKEEALHVIKGAEVTRFKGLGEISPKEFGSFIGEEIRLIPVSIPANTDIHKMLGFFMGANTTERKDFIMENLR